jgi:hydrogenase maturation protein HypF
MAEHELREPTLGFAWDGTGYGLDGTVWGGEAFLCDGSAFQRVAHLRTFGLPGGDRASREPRRSAVGLLFEILGKDAAEHASQWFDAGQVEPLLAILSQRLHCPRTSSMGRLFDAVAAICGLPTVVTFEGHAAMALEFAADSVEQGAYPVPLVPEPSEEPEKQLLVADWEPMIRAILTDLVAGVPLGRISGRFHNGLAAMAAAMACSVAPTRELPIVLSGGCFQNALLTDRVRGRLSAEGFRVYTHQEIPPGDGGIALGQTFIALQQRRGKPDVSRNTR